MYVVRIDFLGLGDTNDRIAVAVDASVLYHSCNALVIRKAAGPESETSLTVQIHIELVRTLASPSNTLKHTTSHDEGVLGNTDDALR